MKKLAALVLFLVSACAGLVPTPAVAQVEPEIVRVPLGDQAIRGLVHHQATELVVVAATDEVIIVDVAGRRTATISDVPGAMDPVEAGPYVVVGSPPVGELVVIDPAAGTVVKRIQAGAQAISSLAAVGDRVWYAHGPDQWDAGVGLASISAGTAQPNQDLGHLGAYGGSIIDVSAARPDRVYLARNRLYPSGLRWGDLGGTHQNEAYHDTFVPFAVADGGSAVWAFLHGAVVELDPDTLERTGFFYQSPAPMPGGNLRESFLANHDDRRLALAIGASVTQYDVGQARPVNRTDFRGRVRGVDVSETHLFAAVSGDDLFGGVAPSELVIMSRDAELPPATLSIGFFGFGEAPGTDRAVLQVTCQAVFSAQLAVRYGSIVDLAMPPGADNCLVTVDGGPAPVYRTIYTADAEVDGSRSGVEISGDPNRDWVDIVDEFPSVYTDLEIFTRQMHQDLLSRRPTSSEYTSWRRAIEGGTAPERLVTSLVESPEFLGRVAPISRLYLAYFRRQPDTPGLRYWLEQMRGGTSIDDISWLFGNSLEFERRYGSPETVTDQEFVGLVYRNVLDRLPDPEGEAYWLGILAGGTSRAELMTAFSESPEFAKRTRSAIAVRALYYGLLGREPDPEGDAYWRSIYEAGHPLDVLVRSFMESREYENRFWIVDGLAEPAAALRVPDAVGVLTAAAGPDFDGG